MRVGITDYAQDALGDIVFVELPDGGHDGRGGGHLGEVESTKSVSEIYAPVAGEVVGGERRRWPTRPSSSTRIPTGRGGSARSQLRRPVRVESLLDAAAYRRADRDLSSTSAAPIGP